MNIDQIWTKWQEAEDSCAESFSGTFAISNQQGIVYEKCVGFRNRSESLPNNIDTAFGLASVTKIFTGLAVCKLVDSKKLLLEDKLCDVLPYDLGQIDKGVTVFHLLTHSSGVGDHMDEEVEDGLFEEQMKTLFKEHPAHLWTNLEYQLQLFAHLPQKFKPGERYAYSNAGYVLLGLVIEAVSKRSYQDFVADEIIKPNNLVHTGFYAMNMLPANVALGYIEDDETGECRTNIYEVPVIGGSDGGLFSCVKDLDKLWRAIMSNKALSPKMTQMFLKPHVAVDEERSYGLGPRIFNDGEWEFYYHVGCEPGIYTFTVYFPKFDLTASGLCNMDSCEVDDLMYELAELLYDIA